MATVKLMFFKGKEDLVDKLICIWTRSKYSHVEIVIPSSNGIDRTYSAFPGKGVITASNKKYSSRSWDAYELEVDNLLAGQTFLQGQVGKKYDYKAIFLTFIFPFKSQEPNKWFCSEYVSKFIKISRNDGPTIIKRSASFDPGKLFERLTKLNLIRLMK